MSWVGLHLCRASESHQQSSAPRCLLQRPALVTQHHTLTYFLAHPQTPDSRSLARSHTSQLSSSPPRSRPDKRSLYLCAVHSLTLRYTSFTSFYSCLFSTLPPYLNPSAIPLFLFPRSLLLIIWAWQKEAGLKCHTWLLHFILHIPAGMSR